MDTDGPKISQLQKAVEENIARARRCFFARGSLGNFHGKLNPLSGKSIFETCVLPVLLYGCENWLLSDSDYLKLERFQTEIGRRILRLGSFHANEAVLGLDLPSMKARIFIQKLSYI